MIALDGSIRVERGQGMARKKRVFISFHYADRGLKQDFVHQAQQRDIQISIVDTSLLEPEPDTKWFAEANRRIQDCDIFMVIMSPNAVQASGVLREVGMAAGLNKRRFQLRPSKHHGPPLANAGEIVPWKWKTLERWFTSDEGRGKGSRRDG
jgi:hypothetical protein